MWPERGKKSSPLVLAYLGGQPRPVGNFGLVKSKDTPKNNIPVVLQNKRKYGESEEYRGITFAGSR